MNRNRYLYFLLIIFTIGASLASRHYVNYLPLWNKLYLGDALWALMVFFVVGFVFKKKSSQWVMIFALAFSFSIEFSQLYQAPWIDAIRNTRIGGLVLGYSFLWSDLICYSMGVCLGTLGEYLFQHAKS